MATYKNPSFVMDEEELATLEAQRNQEAEDNVPDEELTPEERTFKKRYGDLRRHAQKEKDALESRISALESQLSEATKAEIKFPKSEQEVEQWMAKYPDVAAIVKTISMKEAMEARRDIDARLAAVAAKEEKSAKKIAQEQLAAAHPDFFDEIRLDDEFHEWLGSKSQRMQDALYANDTDWQAAAEVIDLYKLAKGISNKKPEKTDNKDAAREVRTPRTSSARPSGGGEYRFSESQVDKMTSAEYLKYEAEIETAIKEGKFDYDLSGGAR